MPTQAKSFCEINAQVKTQVKARHDALRARVPGVDKIDDPYIGLGGMFAVKASSIMLHWFNRDHQSPHSPTPTMRTHLSPTRELLHLAWPMLVAQLAVIGNGVIDTAMAGQLSTLDLAAVGVAASIQVTIVMAMSGILFALPPIVSTYHGANQSWLVGHEVHQSIWIALVLAALAILLLAYPEPLLAVSDLQPEVETKVRAYLDASAWGVPGTLAFRLFIGMSTGIGKPRPVMAFNLLSLLLKVPLNAVFMYGLLGAPALGGPGCAVASSIDAWLMAFLAWFWCLRQTEYADYQLRKRITAPDWKTIAAFLRLGLPIGLTFLADVTAFTFMALFIARLGPTASAAHQIASNLAVLAFMVPLSLGNAAAILAGKALGAGQPGQARRISLNGIRIGLLFAAAVSSVLWIGADTIAALYTPDTGVISTAASLIVLVGFYHLADALQVVAVNTLRGYRKSAVPMVIYTITLWGVGLGGGILLGLTDRLGPARGAAGFWLAGATSLVLVGILVTWYLNGVSKVQRHA
jgi:MATE family multidrug resistance protein